MGTLLRPKVEQVDELVRDLPGEVDEALAASQEPPAVDAPPSSSSPSISPSSLASSDLVGEAHEIAKALDGCRELSERIQVYKEVGQRFKSEWRRVLNIGYSRWPELMPWVNGEQELIALLSADQS
jgi:hypothetical protein